MKYNNYALFYKKTKYDLWHSERPDMPTDKWEDYARKKGYAEYDITDFNADTPDHLHLTTAVVKYGGKYYLPEETIPYPKKEPKLAEKFDIYVKWEDEEDSYYKDYDEIYYEIEGLNTLVGTNIGYIDVQYFTEDFTNFLKKLKKEKHAVFHNVEITSFKRLCWIKGDKVRVLQQEYGNRAATCFDILMNKKLFFRACNKMLKQMQKIEKKDLKMYQDYALKKYGKLLEKSVPYPETEPLKIEKFDIKTEVQFNNKSDFAEFQKREEKPYTKVYTYLNFGDKTEETVLIAEQFAEKFYWFIKTLKEIENAVYEDMEYTKTKLYAFLKDDFVRLVYQDFSCDEQEIIFDVAVNKKWFFKTADKMIKQMEKIADKTDDNYKKYIAKQNNDEELGSTLKELLKPENLIGPFETTEEMMKSLLDDDEEDNDE